MDSNPPGRINPVPYQQLVLSFAVPLPASEIKPIPNQQQSVSFAVPFHQPQTNTQSTAGVMFCYVLLFLLPASASCAKMLGQNHFAETKGHVLTFLYSIFFHKVTY